MPQAADFIDEVEAEDTVPESSRKQAQYLELNAEGRAGLADIAWINEQFNEGTFDAYAQEYIAVVGKKVLGHNKSLVVLREQVSRETGIPVTRIVTSFINRHFY